ncbi:hypothetical protein [Radiobacillus sp. PE A8.2]|uniref:hypothetical protein n=1 Tax=Radiobacillus sp. PE A8.2 TaxID=3380349 RepID=UPI00388F8F7D
MNQLFSNYYRITLLFQLKLFLKEYQVINVEGVVIQNADGLAAYHVQIVTKIMSTVEVAS